MVAQEPLESAQFESASLDDPRRSALNDAFLARDQVCGAIKSIAAVLPTDRACHLALQAAQLFDDAIAASIEFELSGGGLH